MIRSVDVVQHHHMCMYTLSHDDCMYIIHTYTHVMFLKRSHRSRPHPLLTIVDSSYVFASPTAGFCKGVHSGRWEKVSTTSSSGKQWNSHTYIVLLVEGGGLLKSLCSFVCMCMNLCYYLATIDK